MAETCAYLRALSENCNDVGEVLDRLNDFLTNRTRDDRFVTLFLARLDPASRSFLYAGAGHPCFLFDAAGTMRMLDATGLPLGVMSEASIPVGGPVMLDPGQTLLLITDGVTDATNVEGELFGIERVREVITSNACSSAERTAQMLFEAAHEFARDVPQLDDLTAVVLKLAIKD